MKVTVDGDEYVPSQKMVYKGMMLSGVPNFAFTVGYTNASWTLKADITSAYICRLLNHMRSKKYSICRPVLDSSVEVDDSLMGLSSGYVTRAQELMPKQGKDAPWKLNNNYIKDQIQLSLTSLEDSCMHFSPPSSRL